MVESIYEDGQAKWEIQDYFITR